MTKVAVYCRVGNASQLDLDAKQRAMADYIQAHADWCNVGYYADLLPSSRQDEHSELAKLLADAAARKFQRLVVPSVSSLTRNAFTLLRVIQALDANGIKVEFVMEQLTSDNLFPRIPPISKRRIR